MRAVFALFKDIEVWGVKAGLPWLHADTRMELWVEFLSGRERGGEHRVQWLRDSD